MSARVTFFALLPSSASQISCAGRPRLARWLTQENGAVLGAALGSFGGRGWPLAATSRCARRAGRPDGQRTTRRARSLARRTDRVINDQLFEPLDLLTESLDLVVKTGLVARQFVDVILDLPAALVLRPLNKELIITSNIKCVLCYMNTAFYRRIAQTVWIVVLCFRVLLRGARAKSGAARNSRTKQVFYVPLVP